MVLIELGVVGLVIVIGYFLAAYPDKFFIILFKIIYANLKIPMDIND